jgi:hypothetical protein
MYYLLMVCGTPIKKKIALIANLETTLQSMKMAVKNYYESLKKL